MIPVTSAQVTPMAAPEIGLVPMSPLMLEVGTSVMPDLERMVKLAADPRLTAAGPRHQAGVADAIAARAKSMREESFPAFFLVRSMARAVPATIPAAAATARAFRGLLFVKATVLFWPSS